MTRAGPNFLGTSNVVAGVTSFGMNGNCAGTGGVYRVDRADDLTWLATFFARPTLASDDRGPGSGRGLVMSGAPARRARG